MKGIYAVALAVAIMLAGCMVSDVPSMEPVNLVPDWLEPEEISPGDPDPEIQIFFDNTQSMVGFAGITDSPISTVAVALTNLGRFEDKIRTYRLVPEGELAQLTWKEEDPLVIASSILTKDTTGFTYTGDFVHGGPLTAAFQSEAQPNQVRVLVTDLLEQESELNILTTYVENLFQCESHQQLRLYLVESPYDGFVSYPVVKEERLQIQTTYYAGTRPFVIIVAGPVEGTEEIHQILMGLGLEFTDFMVENHRPKAQQLSFRPAQILTESILIEDSNQVQGCTVNLEPHPILKDSLAYSFRKVTANKSPFSRLSLIAETDKKTDLSLGQVDWFQWTAQEGEDGAVTYLWQSCDPPEKIKLSLSTLAPGPAISERNALETGLEDITVPSACRLWELTVLNEEIGEQAYAVQVEVTVPVAENQLSATEVFDPYDIAFAAYGQADQDPNILKRIPDLKLMLNALSKLDNTDREAAVANIQLIIQNYETVYYNIEED